MSAGGLGNTPGSVSPVPALKQTWGRPSVSSQSPGAHGILAPWRPPTLRAGVTFTEPTTGHRTTRVPGLWNPRHVLGLLPEMILQMQQHASAESVPKQLLTWTDGSATCLGMWPPALCKGTQTHPRPGLSGQHCLSAQRLPAPPDPD